MIDMNKSIYELAKEYPQIKDALYELGFEQIKNNVMFNTMAKIMTIEKAANMKKIPIENIIKKFEEYGIRIIDTNRNKILKELILKLHNGDNIEKVKNEFIQKLNKVSAVEVHNAMAELVKESMSVDEAKNFFYIRTLLLKDAMHNEYNNKEDILSLELMKNENIGIRDFFNRFTKESESKNIVKKLCKKLYIKLHNHYAKKESVFFGILKRHGNDEPSKVMSKIDIDILNELKQIESSIDINFDKDNFLSQIKELKEKVTDMIFKEENILYPLVAATLSKKELKETYLKLNK